MSVATGISRVTGFVRNWAMAFAMGATLTSSVYVVTNNIPNMIYELVAGGILSSIFIPIYMQRVRSDGEADAADLVNSALNILLVVLGIVAFAATVFARPLVWIQLTNADPVKAAAMLDLGTYFFRFFAIQIVFYGAGAIITGVLNSHRHFIAPATGPIFNNIVVIITLLGFYVPFRESNPQLAITGLAVGTTLGVVAQMAIMIPVLVKMRFPYRLGINFRHPALARMGKKMLPVLLYVTVNLAAVTFRNRIASYSTDKGPAALQYAWMWYQLPYGVLAVALATAIFPELSEYANAKDWPGFRKQFASGLRTQAALILPAAGMLVGLAIPLSTLYRAGRFSLADVPLVASVLTVWGLGLFSFTSYMFTVKGFYANQDSLTPAITNVFATAVQVTLYSVLTLGAFGWHGLGLPGLPAGDAISYSLHCLLLLYILQRRVGGLGLRGIAWTSARVAVASVVGAAVAFGIVQLTPGLAGRPLTAIVQILMAAVPGLAVAFGLAALMRVSEVQSARRLLAAVWRRLVPSDMT
jgi:putative peptidoglycan lipid II flippase